MQVEDFKGAADKIVLRSIRNITIRWVPGLSFRCRSVPLIAVDDLQTSTSYLHSGNPSNQFILLWITEIQIQYICRVADEERFHALQYRLAEHLPLQDCWGRVMFVTHHNICKNQTQIYGPEGQFSMNLNGWNLTHNLFVLCLQWKLILLVCRTDCLCLCYIRLGVPIFFCHYTSL